MIRYSSSYMYVYVNSRHIRAQDAQHNKKTASSLFSAYSTTAVTEPTMHITPPPALHILAMLAHDIHTCTTILFMPQRFQPSTPHDMILAQNKINPARAHITTCIHTHTASSPTLTSAPTTPIGGPEKNKNNTEQHRGPRPHEPAPKQETGPHSS